MNLSYSKGENLMTSSKFVVAVLSMSISATVLGSGAHGGGHGHDAKNGEPGKAEDVSRSITVEMYDNYYEPETIEVEPGETLRFVVENKGSQVHEFNIGTPAMHEAHQKEMMMMVEHGVIQGGKLNHDMMEMDMGDGQSMKHDDPNSVLLEPGQSEEVVWTFSEEGNIEFACNVPGHYQSGMYGKVIFNSDDSRVNSIADASKPSNTVK
jgi:uncharacterized cupredoxin-like copper-binding protein